MAPLGFLIDRLLRNASQTSNHLSVNSTDPCGNFASRRFVHERHEFVREPRHRTADADSANVWATADATDPAALGHIALDHRTPTTDLHQAFRRAIFRGEVALLVVSE